MKPLRFHKTGLNVPVEKIHENILTNLERNVPWLPNCTSKDNGELVIVGGGTSMKDMIHEILKIKATGAHVMVLNNVHDFCIEHSIPFEYAAILDARDENADFYKNPLPKTQYMVASQCSPAVFEALKDNKVTMWHSETGDAKMREAMARKAGEIGQKEFFALGGGSTVGLRAIYLAYAMGYKKLHLFGYDSSFTSKMAEPSNKSCDFNHHAYEQKLNDDQDVIDVHVGDQVFYTCPTMAKQAYQFQSHVRNMERAGVEVWVYGHGLLPTIAQNMSHAVENEPLEDIERKKYTAMWQFDEYRRVAPGEHKVDKAFEMMDMFEGDSLLDFGCGTGRASAKFQTKGVNVVAVDHAINCMDDNIDVPMCLCSLWDMPDELTADFGYCTDVMEHIPSEKVDDVLKGIAERTRNGVFFDIHTEPDNMGALIGETLHVTVETPEWWEIKLNEYFGDVKRVGDGAEFICK